MSTNQHADEIDHEALTELLAEGRAYAYRLHELAMNGDPSYEAEGARNGLLDAFTHLESIIDSFSNLIWANDIGGKREA